MELKAGSYYRTRDGRKAFVAALAPAGCRPAFVGWMLSGFNCGACYGWDEKGYANGPGYEPNGDGGCGSDLAEEWREPETVKFWVYSFRTSSGKLDWATSFGKPSDEKALDVQLVTLTDQRKS